MTELELCQELLPVVKSRTRAVFGADGWDSDTRDDAFVKADLDLDGDPCIVIDGWVFLHPTRLLPFPVKWTVTSTFSVCGGRDEPGYTDTHDHGEFESDVALRKAIDLVVDNRIRNANDSTMADPHWGTEDLGGN